MNLNKKQLETKEKIDRFSALIGMDPAWTSAVAMTESSLGLNQKSPTGARGVFQMTTIAMKDLLIEMEKSDDDLVDILCGILFLRLLLKRHGDIESATKRFCNPDDRDFYWERVKEYMLTFLGET